MRGLVRALVPARIRALRHRPRTFDYQRLYDEQARNHGGREVVGDGEYELIGRMQLDLLRREGLEPGQTLVDFGCGNGRLARHAIPHLGDGRYFGIDICREFLRRAADATRGLGERCTVRWLHHTAPGFPDVDFRADMLCAFSVFTHMEHEDAYRYLAAARKVVRPGGKLIFSCLPLDQKLARDIFAVEAAATLAQRWGRVRNVATSKDMMEALAGMAGWRVDRWYDGDAAVFGPFDGRMLEFGQSACVLTAPG